MCPQNPIFIYLGRVPTESPIEALYIPVYLPIAPLKAPAYLQPGFHFEAVAKAPLRIFKGLLKGLYWGSGDSRELGVILGLYGGYIGVILGLYWGYIGIMENRMETAIA